MLHQGQWRPVNDGSGYWSKELSAAVCAELDCGAAVSTRWSIELSKRPVWKIRVPCFPLGAALKDCLPGDYIDDGVLEIICSGN